MFPFNITNPGIYLAGIPTSQEGAYLTDLVLAGATANEGDVLTWVSGAPAWEAPTGGGGSGDVVGPSSATDNAIARFDATTGKLIQNSSATVSDTGAVSSIGLVVANPVDGTTPAATFNTNTTAQPVYFTRTGGIDQSMSVSVNDNQVIFNNSQDETDTTNVETVFNTTTTATGKHSFVLKLNNVAKVFFDLLNTRLGIGTSNPTEALDVVGNIKVSGTVDGRDVSADGTKLDYITVTQAVNLDTMESDIAARELLANKATNFLTVNDTLYPTVEAVTEYVASAVVGLLDYRGTYDASTNLYPATGGSGLVGAILKGDFYIVSVAGTLGGTAVTAGDLVIALVDTPAQTSSNWDIISNEVGYTPENIANKVTSISGASTDVQYPSAKLLYDQLALKSSTSHTHLLAAGATDVTITAANLNTLDDGVDSTLHFHATDRARANHTGTQTASTISDFASTVLATVLTGISFATGTAVTAADSILVAIGKLQKQNTDQDTAIALNTAKVTNATHTGEVTGSGALTVDKTAITNKTLVTAAVGDHILVADASDTDNLKKVTVQTIIDLAGGGGNTFNDIYIDQSGGTSDTYGVLTGTINGSNALFTVSQSVYATGTLKVWLNGQLMTQGTGEDFVETTPASGTFTFNTAPAAGSLLTAEYQKVVTNSNTIVTTADYQDAVVRVIHGATAGTTRPAGATYVEWVGSVEPTNATDNDTWVETA